jgi:hypothetical protein
MHVWPATCSCWDSGSPLSCMLPAPCTALHACKPPERFRLCWVYQLDVSRPKRWISLLSDVGDCLQVVGTADLCSCRL